MENSKQMFISIQGVADVYDFIREASKVEGDVLIKRGKFAVDAKSFLGVFSLDVSQQVIVVYPADATDFEKYVSKFQVA